MVRFAIIGIVVAVAFTLYSLVDAAMSDGSRARGVSKPIWVVLIVVLPVIGGILWFVIGKAGGDAVSVTAPDDDPRFTGRSGSQREVDARLKDLEAQLKALDDEVYPGEAARSKAAPNEAEPLRPGPSEGALGETTTGENTPEEAEPGEGTLPAEPETGPIDPNRDPNRS